MKRYSLLLCDPPWRFKNYSDKWHEGRAESRWVGNEYRLMTDTALRDLPIGDLAADNSVLILWATFPSLPQAIDLMKAWGFTYKTCAFTWVKTYAKSGKPFVGMGYYTRANPEIALLGTRGKPLPRLSHSVRQLIVSPVREHSRKPDEVRDRIVELFGDLPRIELFARGPAAPGWDTWGDEAENSIQMQKGA